VKAKLPAKGRKASAASAALLILVIPFEKSVAAHAAMIKNITKFETNIPDQTSIRIVLMSSLVVLDWRIATVFCISPKDSLSGV